MAEPLAAFEVLKQYLIQKFNARPASGGREVVKRCHICGDSKDPTKRHMYIGCRDGVIVYNCFKCNAKGVVDSRFLSDLGCDNELIYLCSKSQDDATSKPVRHNLYANAFSNPIFPKLGVEDASKIQYLQNRLGFPITDYEVNRYKIITDLPKFLEANSLPANLTRSKYSMGIFQKWFTGFLSYDNSMVIMRRIVDEGRLPEYMDQRYIVYNIKGSEDTSKFYVVPGMIDSRFGYGNLSIHIAEGPMDIVSIHKHFYVNNGIYGAACGKSYSSICKSIISRFGFFPAYIHLYPDNDVSDKELKQSFLWCSVYGSQIFIHRNDYPGEKDFGVPLDRINHRQYQIM